MAEAERSPLPTKERTSSGDTVAETFTAVRQSQVKDGVAVLKPDRVVRSRGRSGMGSNIAWHRRHNDSVD